MLKIEFTHAEVHDSGFGLEVNGKSLEDIISEALGTKAPNVSYGDPRLKKFKSNSCDVTVLIYPHDKTTHIEDDEVVYHSVEDLEEDLNGQFSKETTEAESES